MKLGPSQCKDPHNRSKKLCCCGGHNHSNVKRNLNHHGTKCKLLIRLGKLYREGEKIRALYNSL